MTADEIAMVAKVAASLGITKVKFTGGEPLTRRDMPQIIGKVAANFRDVSLTTNGTLLSGLACKLKAAGLLRVNVSLDSLMPETYMRMTGTTGLEDAVKGIRMAKNASLTPVKLNMVVLRGENDTEIPQMMRFAAAEGAVLQLIELEAPKGTLSGEWYSSHHADLMDIEARLREKAERTRTRTMHHRRKYFVREDALDRTVAPDLSPGGARTVEVEIVRPVHNTEFCANCNRLRLSSDGRLVPCLFRGDRGVDILGPLRKGASDDELARMFKVAVSRREPYWSATAPPVCHKGRELGACP